MADGATTNLLLGLISFLLGIIATTLITGFNSFSKKFKEFQETLTNHELRISAVELTEKLCKHSPGKENG